MPRIDKGWNAVDIAVILNEITYNKTALEDIMEWIKSHKPYIVTSPSTVIVKTENTITRITLGIGSIVSQQIPPIKHYTIYRPEWINACIIDAVKEKFKTAETACAEENVEGEIEAVDYTDPVVLLVNNLKGSFRVARCNMDWSKAVIKATINSKPAIIYDGSHYISAIKDEPFNNILMYASNTIKSCS